MNADKTKRWRLVEGMQVMNLRLQRPGTLLVQAPLGMWHVGCGLESSWEQPGALVPLKEWEGVVAALDESGKASDEDGARSTPALGSPSLAWTVEKPRASGMWWWWNLDPRCKPDMVEVRADEVLRWMGLGPTMHWPGLTRVRNVMTVGGVWAGPVNPPETPGAETTANADSATDRSITGT